MNDAKREHVVGRALPLPGTDLDTDRIMLARFLRHLTFDGLGNHVFEDDRAAERFAGRIHPIDDTRFEGAEILIVDQNFGCGSSREHAPQGLHRRGFRAIIGESFGEIFEGNCVSVGLPCVRATPKDLAVLRDLVTQNPNREVMVDLTDRTVRVGNHVFFVEIAEGPRRQFLEGRWDATNVLMGAGDAIERLAASLPSMNRTSNGR